MKKVIIYGTGNLYEKYYDKFYDLERIGVVDSNYKKHGMNIYGHIVGNPEIIKSMQYDFIILLILDYYNLRQELILKGINANTIKTIDDYEFFDKYRQINSTNCKRQNSDILLISHDMNYRGAPLMLYNMAKILNECGYGVDVACDTNGELNNIFVNNGCGVLYFTDFNLKEEDIIKYMGGYKLIIVNTLALWRIIPRLKCLNKKIVWWLHEEESAYSILNVDLKKIELYNNLKIYGVGIKAIEAFKNHTSKKVLINCLQWGIEDGVGERHLINYEAGKLIFAVIGPVTYIKGQDFLIDTLNKCSKKITDNIEVMIIGDISEELKKEYEKNTSVKCFGKLNHERLMKLYDKIGIVLSVSRNDTFPVALIEGMMTKKVCVMSDAVGTTEFISNYENGIIFKSENSQDLIQKIEWCLNNRKQLRTIAVKGYKTYTRFFSKESFKNNVYGIVNEMIANK